MEESKTGKKIFFLKCDQVSPELKLWSSLWNSWYENAERQSREWILAEQL